MIDRFVVVGLANTVIGLGVIFFALYLGAGDLAANLAGYTVGFAFGFVANGRWTFRQRRLTGGAAARYLTVVVAGYVLNVAALTLATEVLRWGSVVGQVGGVAINAVVSYFGMRYFAFQGRAGGAGQRPTPGGIRP